MTNNLKINNNLNENDLKENINENINFNDILMSNLSEKERLGVMYFASITTLKNKIEDNSKLMFKIATLEEDNVIFSTLFFLFVILTGNNIEVKNTLLKCKEEEFQEKKLENEKINNYIDSFNERIKILSKIYLDANEKAKDNEAFQDELTNQFTNYLLTNLKIEKNEESISNMKSIFYSALKIAFGFLNAEGVETSSAKVKE